MFNLDSIIDAEYEEQELLEESPHCSWCDEPLTIYLMGQGFCEDCADKFRALHAKVSCRNEHRPER